MLRPKQVYNAAKKGIDVTKQRISLRLVYEACGPVWGGSADNYWETLPKQERVRAKAKSTNNFARNHYEQHMHVYGELNVEGETFEIDGNAVRDHSWGPRYWQATKSYRFLVGNFGDDIGFSGGLVGDNSHGILHVGKARADQIKKFTLETRYSNPDDDKLWPGLERPQTVLRSHKSFLLLIETEKGRMEVTGTVVNFMPLRNRRNGEHTYIGEGFTEYKIVNASKEYSRYLGKTGYGMSEYLDQGLPELDSNARL
mmetsp:Transcript_18007/g.21880  ORF Transcript_18007/g.21880 Transcript_18007/m.21880 type:complete len:256 (-) Transcript_18007:96-863(-)